jgi:hypothetical protein
MVSRATDARIALVQGLSGEADTLQRARLA